MAASDNRHQRSNRFRQNFYRRALSPVLTRVGVLPGIRSIARVERETQENQLQLAPFTRATAILAPTVRLQREIEPPGSRLRNIASNACSLERPATGGIC
jgi:hypothetical protein